jgi:photosystem II stability/assembly factor-like uncharacterized protein
MNLLTKFILIATFVLTMAFPALAIGSSYSIAANRAADWLVQNQNSDGSWGNNENVKFPYTQEAVMALRALNRRTPAYYWGVTWLENHAAPNVDYKARRVLALAPHGDNVQADLADIQAAQALAQPGNNGWGLTQEYQGSAMDTALALLAYSQLGVSTNLQLALNYLKLTQLTGSDMGWPMAQDSASDPMTTALVVQSLVGYKSSDSSLATSIANGVASLTLHVGTNSPVQIQALATLAYLWAGYPAVATPLLNNMSVVQRYDGSWSSDAYVTALVIRAMAAALGSDLPALSDIVFVSDPNLRTAINKALGRNSMDAITKGDMANLITLNAAGMGISNLTGLEWAVNLTSADLSNNNITSTSPIANLHLTQLQLSGNPCYNTLLVANTSPSPVILYDQWTNIGPPGGFILSIATAPTSPGTVYAGTYEGGIYKTANAGVMWKPIDNGDAQLGTVYSLAVSPDDANVVYAGGGNVYKTTDGGSTWQALETGMIYATVQALAIDPNASQTIYAGTDRGGIYKSADGGQSWASVSDGLTDTDVTALRVSPFSSSTLYAGTSQGYVFRSDNGGSSWTAASNGLPGNWAIAAIAFDAQTPGIAYAGSASGVYKTVDGGTTWNALNAGLPTDNSGSFGISAIAADPAAGGLYVVSYGKGVFKFDPGSGTWQPLSTAGLSTLNISSIALGAGAPGTIYVGTYFDGVGKTADGGASWGMSSNGLTNLMVKSFAVDPANSSILYLGAHKLFESNDGGNSWSAIDGLPDMSIDALAVNPSNTSNIYAGGASGAFSSLDRGDNWSIVSGIPDNCAWPAVIKFDPLNSQRIYVGGNTGLCVSNDTGATWVPLFANDRVTALIIDAVDPAKLFIGTSANGVCASENAGLTWSCSTSGWPLTDNVWAAVTSLEADTANTTILYAGNNLGVYVSADSGNTWGLATAGFTDTYTSVTSLILDSLQSNKLFAAMSGKFYESLDSGMNWNLYNASGPRRGIDKLFLDPLNHSIVYGTSWGDGLYKLIQGP